MTLGFAIAIIGSALAVGLAGIGTIIGTMYIAMGSTGFVAERPKDFGLTLLLSALPSSQGIYGFLVTVLILQKIGLFTGELMAVDLNTGLALLGAALPVGILGLFSGIGQGRVLQSGLKIVAKNVSNIGQAIILGVLLESMAVFGLLITILIINAV